MPQLQSNGGSKHYAYSKSPVYVFNEILKLNGVECHGNKLIVEEVETPHRTIHNNNTFIKSYNFLEPLPYNHPPKPASPTRSNVDQQIIQNVRNL